MVQRNEGKTLDTTDTESFYENVDLQDTRAATPSPIPEEAPEEEEAKQWNA